MIQKLKNLKNFMYRGVHGWCPEDTWNLDYYLAKVISETTNYLQKNLNSYPDGLTLGKWRKILKQISKDIIVRDNIITEKSQLEAYAKRKKALELFIKYFNFLWD